MSTPGSILVVDDMSANVTLLEELLSNKGYVVRTASSGEQALAQVERELPDLVLMDVRMPGLSGYDVCRRLRARDDTALLPVVLVTSADPHEERVIGIESGADDFLSKPINPAELFARVKSLLRIKLLQDEVRRQSADLKALNVNLEHRVSEQGTQLERFGRLKNFFSPHLAEAILAAGGEQLLKTHRAQITVASLDLRGFTLFTDTSEPEEVMELLHAYHEAMGRLVERHGGTLEHFAGDGLMIFFNDPVPIDRPVEQAVRMALAMQQAFHPIADAWARRGHKLGLGIGISEGYATLGAIGFERRWDYAAIGRVTNLAARLCGDAKAGEILLDQRTFMRIEDMAQGEPLGGYTLKGFAKPVQVVSVKGLRPA